ncbi:MAG: phBC6A51 family helix-turn-helix protein [Candidatus Moranbacteria bacterium]|nr:phBC6A51 family helix-turn-helix protein [Candidatus Moranbacteria bacterium]
MKKNRDKELILEQLKKIPIMMVACEKVGIARSTVYRWRDDDKKFAKELEEALVEGESLINDMSESQLLSMIREKNWSAISFWLRHRNPKFRERVEVTAKFEKQEELTAEQEEVVREALKLASIDK